MLTYGSIIKKIRFSRSLGFGGFMDFQKMLRKEYQDKVLSISNTITVPAQRVAKRAKLERNSDYINRHFKNALSFVMLHMWSMGLMAAVLVEVTWGRICFRYKRK